MREHSTITCGGWSALVSRCQKFTEASMATMDFVGTKLRNNLMDWAEKAGARFHRAGSEWRSTCPLHGGNNPDAFAVYDDNGEQKWKCFTGSCGQGDIYDFVQLWQDTDLPGAYRILGGDEQPDPAAVARSAAEHARRAEIALQEQIERAQRALDDLRHAQTWLAYHEELTRSEKGRRIWQHRGIANDWQDFWKLGICRAFPLNSDSGPTTSPTLTIPVHDENWQVVNVRHRLLKPPRENDKYRPEKPGLPAAPFIANPNVGFNFDRVLVVEGEIKSMVAYETLYAGDDKTPQVIGIPGKTQFRGIVERLAGRDVYICFDPDAGKEATEAARMAKGAKIINLPMKVDDAILAGALDASSLMRMMYMARKVA